MELNKNSLMIIANQFKLDGVLELFEKYHINTVNRAAGFLAQCSHESSEFRIMEENLNYSADALLKVFPKYFKDMQQAKQYARNPDKIANLIYANRMGNGDQSSGDGFKYKGRGYIQLTGKNNYTKFAEYVGKTIDDVILYCTTPKGALDSALFYWETNNINAFCDKDDIKTMTKAINGGYNGLEDRTNKYEKYKKMLENSEKNKEN